MFLVDTHAHLYLDAFDEDRPEALARAREAGLAMILLPNIDASSIPSLKALTDSDPGMFKPMMGLHPTSVKDDYEDQLAIVERELRQGGFHAVGEIGIDLYWDKAHYEEQAEAFDRQLEWARELGLPVAIHMRDSYEQILDVIGYRDRTGLTGVFHCFTGSRGQAEQICSMGFHLGIGGVLTFKNSKLASAISDIPRDRIVLETDAPFLAPAPHRGKRNESSYIGLVAERLSDIWACPVDEVARITTDNACRLFHLENPYH